MRKLPSSIAEERNHVWCYELPDGRRINLDRDAVRKHGAEELVRELGLDPGPPGERVPVYMRGEKIGSLPASFDPDCATSRSPLFSVRPTDFRREADRWIACPSLGPGDLGALAGFRPDGDRARYQPAELTSAEEEAFAKEGPFAGMTAYLDRALRR
jgi:hypothetical protein